MARESRSRCTLFQGEKRVADEEAREEGARDGEGSVLAIVLRPDGHPDDAL